MLYRGGYRPDTVWMCGARRRRREPSREARLSEKTIEGERSEVRVFLRSGVLLLYDIEGVPRSYPLAGVNGDGGGSINGAESARRAAWAY